MTETLCHSMVVVAEQNGGCLAEQAEQVAQLFKNSFGLFGACHSLYNAKYVKDNDIANLGE